MTAPVMMTSRPRESTWPVAIQDHSIQLSEQLRTLLGSLDCQSALPLPCDLLKAVMATSLAFIAKTDEMQSSASRVMHRRECRYAIVCRFQRKALHLTFEAIAEHRIHRHGDGLPTASRFATRVEFTIVRKTKRGLSLPKSTLIRQTRSRVVLSTEELPSRGSQSLAPLPEKVA